MTIKLLVYSSYLGSGGAEKHTVRVLNELAKLNYEIRVVCPNKVGDYEAHLDSSILLIKKGSGLLYKLSSTLGRFTSYWGLKKEVKLFQPDIFFSVQDIHNLIAIRVYKKLVIKPKLVLAVQNSVLDAYADQSNWVNRLILKSIKYEYQLADKIIALSKGVNEGLVQLNSKLIDKTKVIYNAGLDNEMLVRFYDEATGATTENTLPVLVSCGRLTYQKGYPYMFEALKLLKDKGVKFKYQILGRGELEDELKKQVDELGVKDEIEFLGFKNDPFGVIAQADIFVLPSLYEGFGNVIVEAMVCGTPVIATDCPHGPNEIINSPDLGILVPVKNPTFLAKAIETLINDTNKRNLIVKNAKKRALDFKVSNIAKEHDELFHEIVDI